MSGDRPNLLLVTADQWRGDCLGAAGHPVVRTPGIDAVAAEGCLFRRHYAACAPCSPARASLYTGLYQMNHRVVWNGTPLDDRFDNIARAARRAGYLPTLFGYTDTAPDPRRLAPGDPARQSYEGVLPGFHVRQELPEDGGPWLSWLGTRGHDVRGDVHAVAPEPGQRISRAPPRYAVDETQSAFLVEAFLRWLAEQERGRPWFAHVSFLRPHPPFVVPEPYNRLYDSDLGPDLLGGGAGRVSAPGSLGDDLLRAQPLDAFVPAVAGRVADLGMNDFRRLRALYWGMVSEVDAQIDRIVTELRRVGAWERTIVVLTSDHAEMLGDHGLLGKGGFREQSYHIPLVVRVPDGARGVEIRAPTSAVDLFPTVLELLGVSPEHAPDGVSLVPFLAGREPEPWREQTLWEYDFRFARDVAVRRGMHPPTVCCLAALRGERFLYVHSPAASPALFDLAADAAAAHDRAADPEFRDARLDCAETLLALRARHADDTLARRLVWDAT